MQWHLALFALPAWVFGAAALTQGNFALGVVLIGAALSLVVARLGVVLLLCMMLSLWIGTVVGVAFLVAQAWPYWIPGLITCAVIAALASWRNTCARAGPIGAACRPKQLNGNGFIPALALSKPIRFTPAWGGLVGRFVDRGHWVRVAWRGDLCARVFQFGVLGWLWSCCIHLSLFLPARHFLQGCRRPLYWPGSH